MGFFDGKPRSCIIVACTAGKDFFIIIFWLLMWRKQATWVEWVTDSFVLSEPWWFGHRWPFLSPFHMENVNNTCKEKKKLKANNVPLLKPELFLYVHLQCLAVSRSWWFSGSGPIFVMEVLLSCPVWLCPHWIFLSVMYKHHFEGVITVALPALPFFYILYILSVVAFSQPLQ